MELSVPLYSMPPEIWLHVLAHLSEPDYLSLKRASPHLRALLINNAHAICNIFILTHYAEEALLLGTTIRDGWLVPTHPAVLYQEKRLADTLYRARSLSRSRGSSPAGDVVRTKLSEPGPQYLRFLIEYSFDIRVASSMFLGDDECRYGCCDLTPQDRFGNWVGLYAVRKFLCRLHQMAGVNPEWSFGSSGRASPDAAMPSKTEEGLAWFYS